MKTERLPILASVLLSVLCVAGFLAIRSHRLTAQAQTAPVYLPRVGGTGSNATLLHATRIGTGNFSTNGVSVGSFYVWGGGAVSNLYFQPFLNGVLLWANGVPMISIQPGGIAIASNLVIDGVYYGDGSGITNLSQIVSEVTFLNNVLLQSNITVSGKATFNNNVFFLTTETMTNAAPTGYVDFGKDSFTLATNNNVSFAAAQNWSTSNMNDTIINFTNNGATPKTAFSITMHGTYQNMKAEEGNTLYCTNVGQLLVWGQQGQTGTNFYWKSR